MSRKKRIDWAALGVKDRLCEAQNHRCAYCGTRMEPTGRWGTQATLEHVVPICLEGADAEHNLVIACERCNHEQNSKIAEGAPPMTEQLYRRRAGEPVPLAECPVGLFECGGELCLKTEYGNNEGRIDAYIVSSGEFFWGAAPQTIASQRATVVTPIDYEPLPAPAPDAREELERLCEAIRTADAKAVLIEDDAPSYSVPKGLWEVICGAALARIGGGA